MENNLPNVPLEENGDILNEVSMTNSDGTLLTLDQLKKSQEQVSDSTDKLPASEDTPTPEAPSLKANDELKTAINTARELGSKATEAIRLIMDLDDKEQALELLKSKPAIYNEAKKRFPEELKSMESNEVETPNRIEGLGEKILSRVEQELNFEKVYKAKEFAKLNTLNEDEYLKVKETADEFAKSGMDYERSLKSALLIVNPDKLTTFKSPERAEVRGEEKIEALVDGVPNEFTERMTGIPKSLMKEAFKLQSLGGKVSYDDGQLSVSI